MPTAGRAKQGNPGAGTVIGEPDGSLPATDHSQAARRRLSQGKEYLARLGKAAETPLHFQDAVIGYVVGVAPEPPALPAVLLKPWPVIVVITSGWLIAVVLAFTVPGLHEWRPFTVAGLGVGVLGTSIFLWQRHAVRRGSRGAQSGLS
jgi:Protein of unknown function (DUF2530)